MKLFRYGTALCLVFVLSSVCAVYADTGIDGSAAISSSFTMTGPVYLSTLTVTSVSISTISSVSSATITNLTINGTLSNVLAGLSASTGTLSASDTVLQAFNKIANARIVQVVSGTTTSFVSTTSNSYQSTNLTASITPQNANNKVLIIAYAVASVVIQGYQGFYTIFRDSNNLFSNQLADITVNVAGSGGSESDFPTTLVYLDSPNTTSSRTYTVKLKSGNGTSTYWGNGEPETILLVELGQ